MVLQAWYNLTHLGGLTFTGYGGEAFAFTAPIQQGLAGVLVSPSRGLFVYSPFLLVVPFAVASAWNVLSHHVRLRVLWISLAAIAHTLLIARWHSWAGGWSYGPRLMTETAVLLGLVLILTYPAWRVRPLVVSSLVGLWLLSAGIHSLNVFWPNDRWNEAHSPDLEAAAFGLRQPQIATHVRVMLGE